VADVQTGSEYAPADPTQHYNCVVEAWAHLLGEDLHYGYFESGDELLTVATDALTNQMLKLADLGEGLTVLDVGCGTGKAASRMAQEFESDILGISPSISCIEGASELVGKLGLSARAKFEIGDGTSLSQADKSFDRVWVMESSHLMDDKGALLRECSRVLKPGGRLVLCDIMLDHKLSLQQVIEHRDEFLLLRDVFGRAKMEPLDFYSQSLEANRFNVVHRRYITLETSATFDRWRDNAIANKSNVEELIGSEAWAQFYNSCDVMANFWKQGILGYGIVAAVKSD
jgi:27-O-demethylrifamycin SV methyltransferase